LDNNKPITNEKQFRF